MNDQAHTQISISIASQVSAIAMLSKRLLGAFQARSDSFKPGELDRLDHFSRELTRLAEKIASTESKIQNLEALGEISQLVNSSLELDQVLRTVMDTIISLTGAERGFLMLKEEDGELQIRTARNWDQESVNPSDFSISRTIIEQVAQSGRAVVTTNAQEDPRFESQASIITHALRSILCVPLAVKENIIGVIYADNRIRAGMFDEKEKELIKTFSNQAAIAIENARLYESVKRTLEEVTELKNLMDNVFASIASGVITADIENKVMLINRSAERILGMSDRDIVGSSMEVSFPPIAKHLSQQIEDARAKEQQTTGREAKIKLPDRGALDLSFNVSPLMDAGQTVHGVAIVMDDLTEKKRLEAQRRMFERMVSPSVIDLLDPDALRLGGNRREITTLFADIRGFTSFSEKVTPEELVNILNQYLSVLVDAVLSEQGTIDKFLGDAIMAWYNAPIEQEDHTLRAVRSAIRIQYGVKALRKVLPPELHLSFGVGIHYGDAVLGLIGTDTRMEYTAIGDSVNTAKRIQENTAANQIFISGPAYKFVKDRVNVTEVEPIHAKGKSEPLVVYEVHSVY